MTSGTQIKVIYQLFIVFFVRNPIENCLRFTTATSGRQNQKEQRYFLGNKYERAVWAEQRQQPSLCTQHSEEWSVSSTVNGKIIHENTVNIYDA